MATNYLTVAEFKARFDRQFAKLYDDGGSPNDDWIEDDIEEAEGRIDGYLSRRYVTPITGGGDARLLRGWTRTLAMYYAEFRLPGGKPSEKTEAAAKRVFEELEAAATGEMLLGGTVRATEPTSTTDAIIVAGNDPIMDRDDLGGF